MRNQSRLSLGSSVLEREALPRRGSQLRKAMEDRVRHEWGSARESTPDGLDRPVLCSEERYFFSAATVIIVAMRSAPFVS